MKYIFANWKMYITAEESRKLAHEVVTCSFDPQALSLAIFPSMIVLSEIERLFEGSGVAVGAQNVAWSHQGAYTGAVSAFLCKEAGCRYALVGHSERRYIFGENHEDVRKKIEACFDVGLTPVLCIGETKEDMEEKKREYRLKKQLMSALEGLSVPKSGFIVAYEPVWAIAQSGIGTPCTPAEAESVHQWIKAELAQYTTDAVPVLYGGSVDTNNVVSYLTRSTIDGVLVGSASTRAESFLPLLKAATALQINS